VAPWKTKSPTLAVFEVDVDVKRLERTKRVAGRTLKAIGTGYFIQINPR